MSATTHPFEEHNAACERARLSSCNCFCHGAGHQYDLIKRAVSCAADGANNLAQLLTDLQEIYGGFHTHERDTTTPSRRKIEDIASISLDNGRGATWLETLLVDEGLHASFIHVAKSSVALSEVERADRVDFVQKLTEGAFKILGGDLDSHNISDGHLWCSVVAEACASLPSIPANVPDKSSHGRICYPRRRDARVPRDLAGKRSQGVAHFRNVYNASVPLSGKDDIVRLIGAASCPDLWHHPAAVRYSLLPFVSQPVWPPSGTTSLAIRPRFDLLEARWLKRGNW